jgi:radical SAM-linked protein
VRLRYAKRGKVRWISHRDVARALERAFRISELPLAFTEGFSPRPKVSFGLALSTGHESDAEYLDLELVREVDLDALPDVLSAALPEGMQVTGAERLVERAPALQEIVTAVEWRVGVVDGAGAPVAATDLGARIERALAAAELPAERRRKGRQVVEDVRPVIRRIDVIDEPRDAEATTEVIMELSTQPRSAKPGEILAAIARVSRASGDLVETRALRLHQWIERDGTRLEPHDADTRPRARGARVMREGSNGRVRAPRRHRDDDRYEPRRHGEPRHRG